MLTSSWFCFSFIILFGFRFRNASHLYFSPPVFPFSLVYLLFFCYTFLASVLLCFLFFSIPSVSRLSFWDFVPELHSPSYQWALKSFHRGLQRCLSLNLHGVKHISSLGRGFFVVVVAVKVKGQLWCEDEGAELRLAAGVNTKLKRHGN